MNKTKRKRLERRGWKVGDASEFLGLSPAETQYLELKMELGRGLRDRRQARDLTQADLAQRLGS
ncbi:MAG: transcriptional regulator, partial [Pseudomonadota bacterium]